MPLTDRDLPQHPGDDRFLAWGEQATGVMERHFRTILMVVVLVVVLGVGWVLFDRSRVKAQTAAQGRLAEIAEIYPGSGDPVEETSIRLAAEKYEAFLADSPGGTAARMATFYLAQAKEALGEPDAARAGYESLLSGPPEFARLARLRLAYLHMAAGESQAAGAAFESLRTEDPTLAPQAALELGRLAELTADADTAIKQYVVVAKSFPDTSHAVQATMRIRALGGDPDKLLREPSEGAEGGENPTDAEASPAPAEDDAGDGADNVSTAGGEGG